VGNFGSNDLVAFRAVGSGVNLAARLEAISNNGRITVSYPIYAACKDQFEFSELKEYQFKGFSYAHRVCELIRRL
jgi:class 3 adenylate cyclase